MYLGKPNVQRMFRTPKVYGKLHYIFEIVWRANDKPFCDQKEWYMLVCIEIVTDQDMYLVQLQWLAHRPKVKISWYDLEHHAIGKYSTLCRGRLAQRKVAKGRGKDAQKFSADPYGNVSLDIKLGSSYSSP